MDGYDIYVLIWSVFAIVGGGVIFTFTDQFIKKNREAFLQPHQKTGIKLFRRMAKDTESDYHYILVKGLGIMFVVVGCDELYKLFT